MPSFGVEVLCPADPQARDAEHRWYYSLATDLGAGLPGLAANAMITASRGIAVADGAGWPVKGQLLEPALCSEGHMPLTVVMTMNRHYSGFDFAAEKHKLHAALRLEVWYAYLRITGGKGPAIPFAVRVEFVDAAGSEVLADGTVTEEYGGNTKVTNLTELQ